MHAVQSDEQAIPLTDYPAVFPLDKGTKGSVMLARWLSQQIHGQPLDIDNAQMFTVVENGKLLAAVAYFDYKEMQYGGYMEVGIAATSPRWCTRRTLHDLFRYPFMDAKCVRLACTIKRDNKKSRSLVERLGFRLEGNMRKGWDGKHDLMLYSMLDHECRWIREKK